MRTLLRALAPLLLLMLLMPAGAVEEDGYDLWLRYRPLEHGAQAQLRPHASAVVYLGTETPAARAAIDELQRALGGMLGKVPVRASEGRRYWNAARHRAAVMSSPSH